MATRSEDLIGLTEDALADLEDFEHLYDATAESVLRYFFRRTACPETAADLTVETFAVALGSMETYLTSRGSPRQWLFGIARNQLSRYVRWRRWTPVPGNTSECDPKPRRPVLHDTAWESQPHAGGWALKSLSSLLGLWVRVPRRLGLLGVLLVEVVEY